MRTVDESQVQPSKSLSMCHSSSSAVRPVSHSFLRFPGATLTSLLELMLSAPRWPARGNQPTEATIPEESSPTPSRFKGVPIRQVNEPPLIFSRPSGRRRAPNSPSVYSPTVADHTPFGLSPTNYSTAFAHAGGESPRARQRTSIAEDSTSTGSSSTKVGIVDRIGEVFAGLAGRKSPESDVERALAMRSSQTDK